MNNTNTTIELNKDMTAKQIGQAIAKLTGWDGFAIMEAMKAALTDANFHAEAEQVQKMLDAE
jgi:hypothetical protein